MYLKVGEWKRGRKRWSKKARGMRESGKYTMSSIHKHMYISFCNFQQQYNPTSTPAEVPAEEQKNRAGYNKIYFCLWFRDTFCL